VLGFLGGVLSDFKRRRKSKRIVCVEKNKLTQENILRGPRPAGPSWFFSLLHPAAKRIRNSKDPWDTRRYDMTNLTGFFVGWGAGAKTVFWPARGPPRAAISYWFAQIQFLPPQGLHAVHFRHIQVLFTPFGTGRGLDELYMRGRQEWLCLFFSLWSKSKNDTVVDHIALITSFFSSSTASHSPHLFFFVFPFYDPQNMGYI